MCVSVDVPNYLIRRIACAHHGTHRPEEGRWIGLHNTVGSCGCGNQHTSSTCLECRSRFTWMDGADATAYESWTAGSEPDSGEACVRLRRTGTWWGNQCHSGLLKFICKYGNKICDTKTVILHGHPQQFVQRVGVGSKQGALNKWTNL